ncbi:hypothetical protein MRX96_054602 [Rhipicephalus microplus]
MGGVRRPSCNCTIHARSTLAAVFSYGRSRHGLESVFLCARVFLERKMRRVDFLPGLATLARPDARSRLVLSDTNHIKACMHTWKRGRPLTGLPRLGAAASLRKLLQRQQLMRGAKRVTRVQSRPPFHAAAGGAPRLWARRHNGGEGEALLRR